MDYLRGVIGLAVIVLVAFIFSSHKKKIDWRLVGIGISLQLVFGVLITKVPLVASGFSILSDGFVKFLSFSRDGAAFIFGDLAGMDSDSFSLSKFYQPLSFSQLFLQVCIIWVSCKKLCLELPGLWPAP